MVVKKKIFTMDERGKLKEAVDVLSRGSYRLGIHTIVGGEFLPLIAEFVPKLKEKLKDESQTVRDLKKARKLLEDIIEH